MLGGGRSPGPKLLRAHSPGNGRVTCGVQGHTAGTAGGPPGWRWPRPVVDAGLPRRLGQGPSLRRRKTAACGESRRRFPKFCALGSLATPRIGLYFKGLEQHGPASAVTYMAIYGKQEALIWKDRPGGPGVT